MSKSGYERFMAGATNKEKARTYHQAVSAYDVATVEAMVDPGYIQHNPRVPTGRDAFVAVLPKLKAHDTKIENVRILQDGPYVAMHHMWKHAIPFGADEVLAFHVIRFDDQGLIAEHWSVMMPKAEPNPSGRSAIDGETEIRDFDRTEENKATTTALLKELVKSKSGGLEKLLPRFFHADFHQHHPAVADGIGGLVAAHREATLAVEYRRQHRVLGEGNFVLSISEGTHNGRPSALYDLFRFADRRIAEHWSIYQEIPAEGLANDNTMFNFT